MGPAGGVLGWLGWHVLPAQCAHALANLAAVFPDLPQTKRRAIARGVFRHLGVSVLEAVRLPLYAPPQRMARVSVRGVEILDEAFREGRGVVAATGHLGNWEVLAACFADLGYPVHVVARRHPNPGLQAFILALRRGYGVQVLDRDRDTRRMLKALRQGEIVALLVDQDTRVQGAMLPFLGIPAYTPLGHARLAVRTGAAMIVLSIVREASGMHQVTVWERVRADVRLPEEVRVRILAARCNEILGEAIRATPSQWVWFHRRWRTREGAAA